MSNSKLLAAPTATLPSSEIPKIILNIPNSTFRADLQSFFEENGFDVRVAESAQHARTMISEVSPVVSILSVDQNQNESSWLVCKKIMLDEPSTRVLLIGNKPSVRHERKAHFLGAVGYVSSFCSPQIIARTALGTDLPSRN